MPTFLNGNAVHQVATQIADWITHARSIHSRTILFFYQSHRLFNVSEHLRYAYVMESTLIIVEQCSTNIAVNGAYTKNHVTGKPNFVHYAVNAIGHPLTCVLLFKFHSSMLE